MKLTHALVVMGCLAVGGATASALVAQESDDCPFGDEESYAQCHAAVSAILDACLVTGGDPFWCYYTYMLQESSCYEAFCIVLPEP